MFAMALAHSLSGASMPVSPALCQTKSVGLDHGIGGGSVRKVGASNSAAIFWLVKVGGPCACDPTQSKRVELGEFLESSPTARVSAVRLWEKLWVLADMELLSVSNGLRSLC